MSNAKDKASDAASRKPGQQEGQNVHGEGNYAASRQYNEGVRKHLQSHDVEKEARDAAPRSDAEAQAMKVAESRGKARAKEEDPVLGRRSATSQRGPEDQQTPKPGQEE